MIKHCLVRCVVTDPKKKADDVIVSLTHNRAMWWRRWTAKIDPVRAKPGRVVARGESFGLPGIEGTQWVTFDKSEPTPDIQWMALHDNTPSVVEVEDPITGEVRFFADEASAMKFMMSL